MAEQEGVFPWSLAEELLQLIRSRDINTIRYCDVEASTLSRPSRFRYVDEFVRSKGVAFTPWSTAREVSKLLFIRLGKRLPGYQALLNRRASSPEPPTVFIEHDADLLPERTLRMMALERQHGLVSSNYFFAEHADPVPYDLDIESMQAFERDGFEIGYHQNAYERSDYDRGQAFDLVARDLARLREHFDVRSFVPHGGTPSSRGQNNHDLPHDGELAGLLWAYNGDCLLKEFTWSDGGITKETKTDPREFIKGLPNGTRATMLIHPQYYADELRADWRQLPIAKELWWRELWGL